ncbi:MAG: hypothetical protein JOY69_04100 [Candidatus Eremiobacteraeota bacterium]|nr:hypothetical protein [Candidatus Eremiobacteraeota bacterium]MBV8372420.1 hypothetical protein [Candidatus Eremiobacteraeota bacterium]
MFAENSIAGALSATLQRIDVPACPLAAIRARIGSARQLPPLPERRRLPQTLLVALGATAAALALVVVTFPSTTLGFVQTVEQRTAAILGWTPPPPPPKSLSSRVASQAADLVSAQARVGFRIVPPAGLPSDIIRARVWTTPTLIYSKVAHSWSKGEPVVTFAYDRTRHRSFNILVSRYNPRFGPPPKYMYEEDSTGGRRLVKHLNFEWRNGDQETGAIESADLSVSEIKAIRSAMHGTAIPPAANRAERNSGTLEKQIYLLKPKRRRSARG